MKAELIFILEKFPRYKEQIQLLFDCDEEFQALCLDYFLCNRSLDNLELTIQKLQDRLKEYVELERVLEKGMLQYLNQQQFSVTGVSGSEASNTGSPEQK